MSGRPRLPEWLSRTHRTTHPLQAPWRGVEIEQASRHWLHFIVLPVWLGAGLADWYLHRKTRIERTAGTYESLTHVLMMAEGSVPALAAVFLNINAGALLAASSAYVLHELTVHWDVSYAEPRRYVSPTEQQVHAYLEAGPLLALSFLLVLNWQDALSLVGASGRRPDFSLRLKKPPASRRYIAMLLGSIGLFGVLPLAEELWRCWREDHTLAPHPEPEVPATPMPMAPGEA